MRKRVTFVEQLKNGSGHAVIRSAESNKSCKDGFERVPHQKVRETSRGTHTSVSAGSQHMRTMHVPKSIMSAPFLQHPALTAGQKRYLCSVATVYSTEHMRQQMRRHYLNLLRTSVHSGQNLTCRRRYGEHQLRGTFPKEAEPAVTRAKPQGQRKSNLIGKRSSIATSDVILPKIVNR